MAEARTLRDPLVVSIAVWKALFLREAVGRLSQNRTAWLWVVVEPLAHVLVLMWIRIVLRQRVYGGMDPAMFIILGVMGFFVVRNMLTRSSNAISQSAALYSYRQIKPVDTILVRAVIEGLLAGIMLLLLLAGTAMFGKSVTPADPLLALAALAVLWFTGLALGLIVSVLGELLPELARTILLMMTPLYFLSAVMYQTFTMPHTLREALLYNPFVHSLETLRIAFTPTYRVPEGITLAYPAAVGLVLLILGLALHLHFQPRLIAR